MGPDVLELRSALEQEAAALAAHRRTDDGCAKSSTRALALAGTSTPTHSKTSRWRT